MSGQRKFRFRKMKSRRTPRKTPPPPPAAPASPRTPTYDDILAIARLVESGSRFTEFRLRSGDIEVEVKRGIGPATPASAPAGAIAPTPTPTPAAPAPPVSPVAQATARAEIPALPAGTVVITAPMVGTFYRSPQPGAPPFVEVGDKVEADTVLCIIEVMKLMNSVTAGVKGTVSHVFVENAQVLEHGQAVMGILPR